MDPWDPTYPVARLQAYRLAAVTEVVVFHHAQGLTSGVVAFADELRAAGHTVYTPDLYDGRVLATRSEGLAVAQELSFGTIVERGRRAVVELPIDLVYIGFSLGVLPAQTLAQTRPGARGAILAHSAIDPMEFGGAWPDTVPLQLHMVEGDELALPPNEDLATARALGAATGAHLFLYPGTAHLPTDRSLPDYDVSIATPFTERVLAFLAALR